MSMLAGPRRKQTIINLRAKNDAWTNDKNKFGQRMLEKMGWSSGKGLGAKENGMVEHVVVQYKNDEKGLGYKEKDDQWTKQEEDYNTLLEKLSKVHNNKETHHSVVSLEEKSKKSKARIHYHKFTRGKDVSRYSEKDLAAIFGKKTPKPEEKVEKILKVDDKSTEEVFLEKGSMEDYFKNKGYKLTKTIDNANNMDSGNGCKGFFGADEPESDAHQSFGSLSHRPKNNESEIVEQVSTETLPKKKKRKSKLNKDNLETEDNYPNFNSKDKSKKNKKSLNETVVEEYEPVIKKCKKKKLSQQEVEQEEPKEETLKKHKKKKSKHVKQ